MGEIKFQKGVNVKCITTQYGKILKVGVHLDEFKNQEGWLNFDLKCSKEGNWYAVENTYKKDQKETVKDVFNGQEIDEEIPW